MRIIAGFYRDHRGLYKDYIERINKDSVKINYMHGLYKGFLKIVVGYGGVHRD